MLCYIGLGSNLNHPRRQLEQALATLSRVVGIHLLRRSPWYVSQAVGPGSQPDYLNGVLELETCLTAEALLDVLQQVEAQQGRERTVHWGPRTLDLDLLLYGTQVIDSPGLQVPHPRLGERAFVLAPLADLAPSLCLPAPAGAKSATIAALLAGLSPPAETLHLLDGEREVVKL